MKDIERSTTTQANLYKTVRHEIFKQIKGFPLYEVGDMGSVRRIGRSVVLGSVKGHKYKRVNLRKEGKVFIKYVHRLVAETFIPNPQCKIDVNHINGLKTDNRIENLEWATRSENNLHASNLGLNNKSKKVICDNTGIVFPSASIAAKNCGYNSRRFRQLLNDPIKNKTGYSFV